MEKTIKHQRIDSDRHESNHSKSTTTTATNATNNETPVQRSLQTIPQMKKGGNRPNIYGAVKQTGKQQHNQLEPSWSRSNTLT
jgi:hypothetical protein